MEVTTCTQVSDQRIDCGMTRDEALVQTPETTLVPHANKPVTYK